MTTSNINTCGFPHVRMRRNRTDAWVRRMVCETTLTTGDLIWPLFVIEGENKRMPVASMPGVDKLSVDLIVQAAIEAKNLGIPAIAVFPNTNPNIKTPDAKEALNSNNLVCTAVRAIKKELGNDLGVICDVALDPYNSDGHDGLVANGEILNDETVDVLCQQAVIQAQAGCDIIAPSDMMDGRIQAIRKALDGSGFQNVKILSYAAKYASGFYGPFREAVGSGSALKGDKKTYQMNPANTDEAIREVAGDVAEGADMVMIKPGMPYLDIIRRIKDEFCMPTFAYQVSGEYAMIQAAVSNGWLEGDVVMMESLMAFKRAGADGILTYFAPQAAKLLATREPS